MPPSDPAARCDAAAHAVRPLADWARAAEGLQLAGFAVFLLLNTTGVLPWSFWLDAIALWPVLIMNAGLKVAFEKSRAPWVVLLGPALVLGSLAWVATGAHAELPVGPWTEETRPLPADATRLRLTANLAGSRLELASVALDPTLLVQARSAARPENARLDVSADADVAHVTLKGGWPRGITLLRKQRWDLRVPATLSLALDLHGAGIRTTADLSAGRVEDGRIDGVFLGTELRLPRPEKPVTLELSGVFNALNVTVPAGVPVRVHGAGFPFNAVDRGVPGAAGAPGYDVKLNGIFSAVTVDSRTEAAPSAAPAPRRTKPEAAPRVSSTPRPKAEAEPAAPPVP